MSRVANLTREEIAENEQAAYDRMIEGRGEIPWIFRFLLGSPELANRISLVGECLRDSTTLPDPLRELLIMVISRELDFQLEWAYHEPLVRELELPDAWIEAVRVADYDQLPEKEARLARFAADVLAERCSDADFARCAEELGERGALEVTILAAFIQFMGVLVSGLSIPMQKGLVEGLPPRD